MIGQTAGIFATVAQSLSSQMARMKVAAENVANSQSTGSNPGEAPYLRKIVVFTEKLDDKRSGPTPEIREEQSAERRLYNPSHPAADASGWVRMPDIDLFVEMADMREANRNYLANLQMYKGAREMFNHQIDLLRGRP